MHTNVKVNKRKKFQIKVRVKKLLINSIVKLIRKKNNKNNHLQKNSKKSIINTKKSKPMSLLIKIPYYSNL